MVAIVGCMVYALVAIPTLLVTVYLQDEGLRSPLGELILLLIDFDNVLKMLGGVE